MPKTELIPDIATGDGKPLDVGHDRALAVGLNNFHDHRSAISNPSLWREYTDDTSSGTTEYYTLWAGIIFLGLEHYGTAFTRSITLAPFFRSHDGASGSIRATLVRTLPTVGPGAAAGLITPPLFADAFAQAEWTTTSTTYATGSDATLSCGVKDLFFGFSYLVVDKKGSAQIRGFSKFRHGARV
jgi:hypothetical protein